MPTPADLIEVYADDREQADDAARDWRGSQRVECVRVVRRTVRAAGLTARVWVVCVWYTVESKARGWNG